jgi:hypothetical protein
MIKSRIRREEAVAGRGGQTQLNRVKPVEWLETWLALTLPSPPGEGVATAALGVPEELAGMASQAQSNRVKPVCPTAWAIMEYM